MVDPEELYSLDTSHRNDLSCKREARIPSAKKQKTALFFSGESDEHIFSQDEDCNLIQFVVTCYRSKKERVRYNGRHAINLHQVFRLTLSLSSFSHCLG